MNFSASKTDLNKAEYDIWLSYNRYQGECGYKDKGWAHRLLKSILYMLKIRF